MIPWGCQLGSAAVSTSRVTQTGWRAPVAPPSYIPVRAVLGEAEVDGEPAAFDPDPPSSPIGEPVTSSFSGSNGTATIFPSALATSRCPLGEYRAKTPRMITLGSPRGSFIPDLKLGRRLVRAPSPEDDAAGAGQGPAHSPPASFRSTAL